MDRSAKEELAALGRMSAEQKLAVMHGLWLKAWEFTAAGVRERHPGWTEDIVQNAVRTHFARGTFNEPWPAERR